MAQFRFRFGLTAVVAAAAGFAVLSGPDAAAAPVADGGQGSLGQMFSDNYRTPLMVVRFNQRRVYFERPLYQVVSKAVAAKSSVMFDIVSVIPAYGEDGPTERSASVAESNLNRVLASLNDMGVPSSRLNVTRKNSSTIEDNEVQIFVR